MIILRTTTQRRTRKKRFLYENASVIVQRFLGVLFSYIFALTIANLNLSSEAMPGRELRASHNRSTVVKSVGFAAKIEIISL